MKGNNKINRTKYEKKFIFFSLFIFIFIFFVFFSLNFSVQKDGALIGRKDDSFKERYYLNDVKNDFYISNTKSLENILAGPVITDNDPIIGDLSAPVSIVLFSDFECLYCHKQEKNVKSLLKNYGNKVNLIWKDYPSKNKSSISWKASIAGRCAHEQNKFWEYHDRIFDEDHLSEIVFRSIAKDIGMDIGKFNQCLSSEDTGQKVLDNIEEANYLDINGIPFLFVNDQQIMGQANLNLIKKIIDIELKKLDSN